MLRRKRTLHICLVTVFVLFVFLGAGWYYRVVLFEELVLPRLQEGLDAQISSEKIEIPSSHQLRLQNIVIGPESDPFLEAQHLLIEFDWSTILARQLTFKRVELSDGVIQMVRNASGKWNFLSEPSKQDPVQEGNPSLDYVIENLTVKNSSFRLKLNTENSQTYLARLEDFSLSADDIGSLEAVSAALDGDIRGSYGGVAEITGGEISLDGATKLEDDWGSPEVASLNLSLSEISFKGFELSPHDAKLNLQLTANLQDDDRLSWRALHVRLFKNSQNLLDVISSGSYDYGEEKGRLKIKVEALELSTIQNYIPKRLARLALSGTSEISFSGNWDEYQSSGRYLISHNSHPQLPAVNGDFQYSVAHRGNSYSIDHAELSLSQGDETRALEALELSGSFQEPPEKMEEPLRLRAKHINVDQLLSILKAFEEGDEKIEEGDEKIEEEASSTQTSSLEETAQSLSSPKSAPVPIAAEIQSVTYNGTVFQALSSDLLIGTSSLEATQVQYETAGSRGQGKVLIDYPDDVTAYEVSLQHSDLPVEVLGKVLKLTPEKLLSGTFTELSANLKSSTGQNVSFLDNLEGTVQGNVQEMKLDRELADYVPFNILFLPFGVLAKLGNIIASPLLPTPVMSIFNTASDKLREQQEIKIENGVLRLSFEKGTVDIEEAEFNMGSLPTAELPGTARFDGAIEINSGMYILGQRIPLPIKGTLQDPSPDVERFVVELLKSVGLSPLRAAGSLLDLASKMNPLSWVKDDKESLPVQ